LEGGGYLPLPSSSPKEKNPMYKKVWINYMLARNKTGLDSKIFNELLDPLTAKELKILKKNGDLVTRVTEICKLTKMGMFKHIKNDYGFEITNCQNGDVWIDASDTTDTLVPEWIKEGQLTHSGWYLTFAGDENEFMPWARNLLLQEVRVNMWLRYMEHKLDLLVKSNHSKKNPFEVNAKVSLPWVGDSFGSGGNYV
jgi:hypothetical protein